MATDCVTAFDFPKTFVAKSGGSILIFLNNHENMQASPHFPPAFPTVLPYPGLHRGDSRSGALLASVSDGNERAAASFPATARHP
jgi:hypothetical protein